MARGYGVYAPGLPLTPLPSTGEGVYSALPPPLHPTPWSHPMMSTPDFTLLPDDPTPFSAFTTLTECGPDDYDLTSSYVLLRLRPEVREFSTPAGPMSAVKDPDVPFPCGLPFTILSIALPFLIVHPQVSASSSRPLILDTRCASLARVPSSYVSSLNPTPKKPKRSKSDSDPDSTPSSALDALFKALRTPVPITPPPTPPEEAP